MTSRLITWSAIDSSTQTAARYAHGTLYVRDCQGRARMSDDSYKQLLLEPNIPAFRPNKKCIIALSRSHTAAHHLSSKQQCSRHSVNRRVEQMSFCRLKGSVFMFLSSVHSSINTRLSKNLSSVNVILPISIRPPFKTISNKYQGPP